FTPYRAGGIYDVGDTVGWTVSSGPATLAYAFKWTIRRNNAVVLKEGKLDLSSGKGRIEIVDDQPGMIYVAVEAYPDRKSTAAPADDAPRFVGGNTGRDTGFYAVGAAVAPAKIGLSTPRPPDFYSFWAGNSAPQTPLRVNGSLTPVTTSVSGVQMSIFELDALGSKVHGYVAK